MAITRITTSLAKRTLLALAAAVLLSSSALAPALADDLPNLLQQGLPYYIPGDNCGVGGGTTGAIVGNDAALPADFDTKIAQLKPMYQQAALVTDLPWQVLAGIHYRESNFSTSKDLQAGNPIGGPWNQASTSYDKYGHPTSLEQSIEIAGKELQDKAQGGLFHKKISASAIDIEVIKDALFGYNGRAEVYKQQAAQLGFDPNKQPYEGSPYVMSRFDAKHTDMKIITHDFGGLDGIDKRYGAFTLYHLIGGPMTGGATADTGGCTTNPAANGNVMQTVVKYAWPDYHKPVYMSKKQEYADAITVAKNKGEYIGGCVGVDCGAFVTRVMRDSGADPQYNKYQSNTDAQWRYLREATDKYEDISAKVNGSGDLQPGDIAVNGHHTYMFVGKIEGFNGNSASASLCERSPMASPAYDFKGFSWFRLKAGATPAVNTTTGGQPQ